jgi:transposase
LGTKIHAAVSEGGRVLSVAFTAAQSSDIGEADRLLAAAPAGFVAVVADKGYDCERFVRSVTANGCTAVIPSRKGRKNPRVLDTELYKRRNVVERFFGRVTQYRRIATRYDKTLASFEGFFFAAVVVMMQSGWT